MSRDLDMDRGMDIMDIDDLNIYGSGYGSGYEPELNQNGTK